MARFGTTTFLKQCGGISTTLRDRLKSCVSSTRSARTADGGRTARMT